MKWAYLKMPDLRLPAASAEERRKQPLALFDKGIPIERWGRKATGLKSFRLALAPLAKRYRKLGKELQAT